MIERSLFIGLETGFHARPCSLISRKIAQYRWDVKIAYKDLEVDAKSVMNLLMLTAPKKSTIKIKVAGPEDKAERLVKVIAYLVGNRKITDETIHNFENMSIN